jgi:hypothetical protein
LVTCKNLFFHLRKVSTKFCDPKFCDFLNQKISKEFRPSKEKGVCNIKKRLNL